MSTDKPRCALLVEDNPADVELYREAFAEVASSIELHFARDGGEAMAFLRRDGEHAEAPRPDLIMLDLNMPRMNGHEVLAALDADDELGSIPVVVFSTSDDEDDIIKAYSLQANCYITKPVSYEDFIEVVNTVHIFWFNTVQLPPGD